jgi:iron complex outermembrane receptor protein
MIKGSTARIGRKTGFRVSASLVPIIMLIGASPALAQAVAAPAGDDKSDADIVVTGSRIARPAADLPTPVGLVTAETLENNNTQFDIGRALAQQPAIGFSGSMQQNQQSGAAGTRGETAGGLAVVDLRSLGSNRTLVLVNGKRRVAGSTDSAAVDLNSINPNLIERVEIITGGASAIYGSDAVSGVVNIITKDTYQGLKLSASGSQPIESSEGRTYGGSLLAGRNFGEDRGNVTLSADYTRIRMITPRHADMHNNIVVNNPANTGTADGIPDQLIVPNGESYRFAGFGSVGARGDTRTLGAFVFNEDGTARAAPTALLTDGNLFGIYANCGATCFRYDDTISIVPDITRYNLSANAHYEFSSAARVYLNVDYNNTSSFGLGQPVQQSAIAINIAQNAYLDPAFRQRLLAAGATTLQLDRSFYDVGLRTSKVDRHSTTATGGLKGKLENAVSDLSYDVYGTYGRTEAKFTGYNRLITANYRAAFDAVVDPATGQVKCRMDVPALQPAGYVRPAIVGSGGCVPFNPFGSAQSSEAARAFVRATTASNAFIEQITSGVSISGDSSKFLTLPGGGAIGIAIGGEYRKESNGRTNDPLIKAGLTTQASSQDYRGGYHVSELFGELSIPLLTDLPFAKLLSIDGAVRRADYSHAGNVTSWKSGAMWEPFDGLRLRGTISHAIRAPNIFEAFRPTEGQTTNITDPCAQAQLGLNPNRAANCAALGRPTGFTPINGGLGVPFTVSGNQNLKPEVSNSWTAGVIVEPRFLPGLQITADWFNIRIKDAISFLSGQDIANNCVDRAGGPDQALCSLITRDATTGANRFAIIGGTSTYVNTSKLETAGLDTQVYYASALGAGRISANLSLTWLHRYRSYTFQARPDIYKVLDGFLGYPKYKGTLALNYAIDGIKLGWQGRYQSSQSLTDISPGISRELLSPDKTGSRFYNDLSASYRFTVNRSQEVTMSLGVTNVLNVHLPTMTSVQAISATAGGFDQFGPVVRAGIDVSF